MSAKFQAGQQFRVSNLATTLSGIRRHPAAGEVVTYEEGVLRRVHRVRFHGGSSLIHEKDLLPMRRVQNEELLHLLKKEG